MYETKDAKVGARLRALRKSAGLSERQVADRLGISLTQIQKFETGINRVSAIRLMEYASIIGFSIDEFADEIFQTQKKYGAMQNPTSADEIMQQVG